jgi:hypothetical protein
MITVRVSGAEANPWRSLIKDSHEVGKVVLRIPINREQTSSYRSVKNASIVLGTVWKSMKNQYNSEVLLQDLKYMLHKLFLTDPRICHLYP